MRDRMRGPKKLWCKKIKKKITRREVDLENVKEESGKNQERWIEEKKRTRKRETCKT